jgi:ABC-type transport system substrate-binding protein
VYRDPSGQRLSVEVRTTSQDELWVKLTQAVADDWQRSGVASEQLVVPIQRVRDAEYRATFPAFEILGTPNDLAGIPSLHSRVTRLPSNNFAGSNYSRMMDPAFDALIERWQATIPRAERTRALGDVLFEISARLNAMPLVYNVRPVALASRLQGGTPGTAPDSSQAWNVQTWDLR